MRDSDRWVTPRVVAAGIFAVAMIVCAAIGAVTYLSAIRVDPAPMLRLAGILAGGASGLASLVLQLVQRRTVAKVERNTGLLASRVDGLEGVDDVDDAGGDDDPWERAYLPPVPPANMSRPGCHGGGGTAR